MPSSGFLNVRFASEAVVENPAYRPTPDGEFWRISRARLAVFRLLVWDACTQIVLRFLCCAIAKAAEPHSCELDVWTT